MQYLNNNLTCMRFKYIFFCSIVGLVCMGNTAYSQTGMALPLYSASHHVGDDKKTTVSNPAVSNSSSFNENTENSVNTVIAIDNLLQETNGEAENKTHKKFARVLKRLHLTNMLQQAQANHSLYLSMANLFSRIKLYPLAMKCYLKTVPVVAPGTATLSYQAITDSVTGPILPLDFTSTDDSLYIAKATWLEEHANEKKEKAVNGEAIIKAFDDGKEAIAYALLLQVKQPVPGKNKVFKGINAGHTFISLIKYNRDSSTVCRSFGFYPQKDNILSGTPLSPTTASVFKNDEGHNWDALVGRFVSRTQFKRVLKLITKFEATEYKLSKNNCADFALQAAAIAGIYISNTKAAWPLGYGNNPGMVGQSILQGKVNATTNVGAGYMYTYNTVLTN